MTVEPRRAERFSPHVLPSGREGVAVLGATGLVGQVLVQRLSEHPWFYIEEAVASSRSSGRLYEETVKWALADPIPEVGRKLGLLHPGAELQSRIVFSAIPASFASSEEPRLASKGHWVVSNASAFRQDPTVPLLIPEVNPETLRLLGTQNWGGNGGGIVTNPNCVVSGVALAIGPIHDAFGIRRLDLVTLQSLSGAGLRGLDDPELSGNVVPHIEGEERKIEAECRRVLGISFPVSVRVNRVAVPRGHLVRVRLSLASKAEPRELLRVLGSFKSPPAVRGLPSSPDAPIRTVTDEGRPQVRLDLGAGGGMAVTVGQVKDCGATDICLTVLVDNLVRGAAGAALLNAELLHAAQRTSRLGPRLPTGPPRR